jgi:6-pyruvoyltetrahydropterin/6-carboxytetrahydropterin synthase
MTRLTKRYPFSASHRLHSDKLSAEENAELFGKCNNPYGHGHNYVLEVSIEGPVDETTGMLLPRPRIDRLVHDAVLAKIDHTDLNTGVPEFTGEHIPTTENLSVTIDRWLRAGWQTEFGDSGCRLARVRIEETARNSFIVTDD